MEYMMEGAIAVVVAMLLYLFFSAILFVRYILYSLGLMGLANRTGVKNAWLAWIPVANVYVLGATADMLEEKRGLSHKWSKFLLILTVAVAALFFLFFVSLIALVVYISMMEGIGATSPGAFFAGEMFLLPMIAFYLIYIVLLVISMALSYLNIICVYKIFEEIAPQKSIKYFLIYVLVPFGDVYCLFKCKNLIPEPAAPAEPPMGDPAFGYDASAVQQEKIMNSEENHYDQENQQ